MKRRRRRLAQLALGALVLALLIELTLRALTAFAPESVPRMAFLAADRRLHCLAEGAPDDSSGPWHAPAPLVGLCPNADERFAHPFGFRFRVRTNERGERIVPDQPEPHKTVCRVWFIGDSIGMGYGVDDSATAAALLARETGCRVRNLSVDSLGSFGALRRFRTALRDAQTHPDLVVWNFHPSDFQDDALYLARRDSAIRGVIFTWRFRISQMFYTVNALRLLAGTPFHERSVGSQAEQATDAPEIAADHPTLRNLEKLGALLDKNDVPGLFLTYPEIDWSDGQPARADPLKLRAAEVARRAGFALLHTEDRFRRYAARHPVPPDQASPLYLPRDGHPAGPAQRIFAEAIAEWMRSRRLLERDAGP